MLLKNLQGGQLRFGEGRISGYIAVTLAALSLLGVLAFHFPEYLTTPELRAAYDVELIRMIMFIALIISGSLGLLNFVRNTNKRAGLVAWSLITIAIALGGHRVEVSDFEQSSAYLGLDWFILDLLGSTLIFIFIEKIIPHRKQAILRPEWQTDLHHFFVNHLIVGFVLLAANQFVSNAFGWAVERGSQEWVQNFSWFSQLLLVLLVADLVQYALHRVYHEVPFFWRFHAIHHSAKTMDWLAGSRQHIAELTLTRCGVLAPIFILGFDKSVIDAYIIIVGFQAVLNHTNAQIKFGWLKYIIVTPQFHHWHHSSDKAAIDRNYAAHFAFIDYLFGTAVRGQNEWPEAYGVVGDYVPEGWIKQQAFPLKVKS
ncbi:MULTISPECIES: sterol desaturase family protein [unclassified Neptuniibacter]|uniref:sterol desaturase family protein n=1 Tax=unclassified Neptuniibacter TaxID=2630693 RepID=UPI0026E2A3B1|nr:MULTISPECIES: sterol desaturase family protein [unclassified Neptuniibacter]MDO6512662.1 sterol desaturase family protein [Neptuniibacter sp. 2_MG-2023]MDO6593490.1 sterol desaturase family protein [Neptuniibacter sp. 1_MG-2023]